MDLLQFASAQNLALFKELMEAKIVAMIEEAHPDLSAFVNAEQVTEIVKDALDSGNGLTDIIRGIASEAVDAIVAGLEDGITPAQVEALIDAEIEALRAELPDFTTFANAAETTTAIATAQTAATSAAVAQITAYLEANFYGRTQTAALAASVAYEAIEGIHAEVRAEGLDVVHDGRTLLTIPVATEAQIRAMFE